MLTDHRCHAPSLITRAQCLQLLRTRAPSYEFSPCQMRPSSTSSEEVQCRPAFTAWRSMRHPLCSVFPLQQRPSTSSNLASRVLPLLKHHRRPPSRSIRFETEGIVKVVIHRPSLTPVILPSVPIHQAQKSQIGNTTELSWA